MPPQTPPSDSGSASPPPPPSRPYLHAIDRIDRNLGRYELTSFFAAPGALSSFIADLAAHFTPKLAAVDAIVGLDALGFVLAGALSERLGKPLILARKGGKLPLPAGEVVSSGKFADYSVAERGEKVLEIRRDLLRAGMGVLVVDEWVDTGAQMSNVVDMLESCGVSVLGIGTLQLHQGRHERADALLERYDVFAANRDDAESVH